MRIQALTTIRVGKLWSIACQLGWYHDYKSSLFRGDFYFFMEENLMELLTQKPKGTNDVVPNEIRKWHTVERLARETAEEFGFREIRIPTFENTKLFTRSVGETTDVVQKEMYSVSAKSPANGKEETSFTLRPEGTAGTMRAVLENGLLNEALPLKLFYILSCFRHEKPQAGRLREFHQFGVEMAGSASPVADAEVISLAKNLLERVGIKRLKLFINSIGCPTCRGKYHDALREFLSKSSDKLCETCLTRLDKNPMRILDCKSPVCAEISAGAPTILDYICEECSVHFEGLKKNLSVMEIEYEINPKIVRGLDYYTKTVFEFITDEIGAQGTVCGGGRYDGLIEQLGGKPTPSLGFGMGLERLILLMQAQGCEFMTDKPCELYIASMGDGAVAKALKLCNTARKEGYWVEMDTMGRGLKAQMKYADKIGAKFSIVLGDNELDSNKANIKNMKTGVQTEISLADDFISSFSNIAINDMFESSLSGMNKL